ncbi:MAG: RNA degradosome polyphosphate kinase, partial [Pseudomonadota bacterium]
MSSASKAPTAASDRYINRELSWLKFNERVLEEAENEHHPLLERLRFLSISANNLDEFYMVRYAGLREQVRAGIQKLSIEGRTPAEQVRDIESSIKNLIKGQQACWADLRSELKEEQIEVLSVSDLKRPDMTWLKEKFESQIFPILTPQAVDPAHPFPFIPNLG